MNVFCDRFNCWLFHSISTDLICAARVKRFAECRKCKGIEEEPKKGPSPKRHDTMLRMIPLNVDRDEWINLVREIQEEYGIHEDTKQDPISARRIAILLGEAYITNFRNGPNVILNCPIVEKDCFDLAMEYRLTCDPLERETRGKGGYKKQVLYTWGVDKVSGMENCTTQLKEWSAVALLIKEEENEQSNFTGDVNGRGVVENNEMEADRIRIFAARERAAFRPFEQG